MLSGHDLAIEMEDEWLANTDEDQMRAQVTRADKLDLYEFVDAWGNPLAYFSVWDYQNPEKLTQYTLGEQAAERDQVVKPHKSVKTGQFLNQNSFQLFSAGPDMMFNTDDDIGNW
jgi:hypothetical protein